MVGKIRVLTNLLCFSLLSSPILLGAEHVAPATFTIDTHRGAPALFIEGRPEYAFFLFQSIPTENTATALNKAGVRLGTFVGNVDRFGMRIGWGGENKYDYAECDRAMEAFHRSMPNGYCIIRVWVAAEDWWIDRHPNQAVRFADGTGWLSNAWGGTKHVSFASTVWREEMGEALRRFVRHILDGPYAKHLMGIQIAAGVYGEWHPWSPTNYPDTSEPMRQAFVKYLQRKYRGDIPALRLAWNDPEVDFDKVTVATLAQRRQYDVGMFRDPNRSRKVMDYYESFHLTNAQAVEYFARIVKQESCGRLLTMALNCYAPDLSMPQEGDHRAAAYVMNSKDIDIIASPHSYGRRQLGQDGLFRNFPASLKLHGKLFIDEGDDRTHLALPGWPAVYVKNMDESLAVLRRQFANTITHGVGLYFMDQSGTFYNDPLLIAQLADMKHWADHSMTLDRHSVAEVALISSLESAYYIADRTSGKNDITKVLYDDQIGQLCRSGAPFDWYLIEDLEKGLLRDYKVYIFLDAFYLSDSQRRAIEKLKSNGRTLVWFYAAGFAAPDKLSLDQMEKITGICFSLGPQATMQVKLNPDCASAKASIIGPQQKLDPLFIVEDEDVDIWGRYVDSNKPSLVCKSLENWNSVYCPIPYIPPSVWRKIYDAAGVHVYCDTPDNLNANASWISLHTAERGTKRIQLRVPSPVYDVFEKKLISPETTDFEVHLPAHRTGLFMLAEPSPEHVAR